MRDWSADEVRSAFEANAQIFTAASAAMGGAIERQPGVVLAATGSPLAFFNQACTTAHLPDPGSGIATAVAFFEERKLPFTVALVGTDTSSREEAERAGLRSGEEQPLMLLDPTKLVTSRPHPEGLEVRPAERAPLDEHVGAGMPPAARDAYRSLLAALQEAGGFELWCGYLSGNGVATAACWISGGVAGIFGVGTTPEARGRGIGEAMTAAAVRSARQAGVEIAFLFASDMGYGIYERMGFSTVSSHCYYAPVKGQTGD